MQQLACVKNEAADLPGELVCEEALPEGLFGHHCWHIGHKGSLHMRLLCKDLPHAFRCQLEMHLYTKKHLTKCIVCEVSLQRPAAAM